MTRKNKYTINISFDGISNKFEPYKIQSSYIGSRSFKDDICISSNSIKIVAFRSSNINLDDIFYNHTSSMYIQILKSLIFYYLNLKTYEDIHNITISRVRKEKEMNSKVLKSSDLIQVLSPNFIPLNKKFNFKNLIKLFDDDEKGEAILIASSYIAKASSVTDEFEKFERLWKAFNKLYKFIGQSEKDHECHIELRKFILNNPTKFPLAIKNITSLDAKQLRVKLRWRALILNDYNTVKKTKAYHDFILRYTDSRIMQVLKETLAYRETYLKDKSLYNSVISHLNTNIQQNINNDSEMVSLLCIKYMYFVRNKLMHGEKIDSTLRLLPNKELKELKWLNSTLEALVIDLINCNDSF